MKAKNRIKIVLAEKETKVKDLANGLEANPITVSRWTSNRQQPSLHNLYRVAEFLNVDVRDLLVSNIKDKSE